MSLKLDDVATQTQYCITRPASSLRIAVVHCMDGPMFVYKEMLRIGSFLLANYASSSASAQTLDTRSPRAPNSFQL